MRLKQYLYSILFGNEDTIDNPYKKSQDYFVVEAAIANVMGVLTGGVFLTGYALWLGASDYLAGILLSLPLFTNFIQLLSALIYEKMERRKTFMIVFIAIYRLMICGIIFIPFFLPKNLWVTGLVIMVALGYAALSLFAPGTSNWVVSLVPPKMRGRYFSRRESIFQTTGMIASLIIGRLIDVMGKGYNGFAAAFGTAIVFTIADIYFLTKIEEPPVKIDKQQHLKLYQLFTIPITNKKYMNFVVYWMVWNFGMWMALPFFSVYMIKSLKLSYTFMTIQNTVMVATLVFAVRWWGNFADKHSWDRALKQSCLILSGVFTLWAFVTPYTVPLLIIIGILSGIGFGGMNMSAFNAVFQISPEKGRTVFLGFQAAFTGLAGFLGPVIGGKIGQWYKNWTDHWKLPWLDHMQLLFLTAAIVMMGALIYAWKKVHITEENE